jgi:hypothetical protein
MVTDVASAARPHLVFRGVIWVSSRLLAAERILVAGLMVLLTGLILLNVVTRYTRIPLYWIDEAAVYSVVFLTFIGASAMTRLRMDFAVTILTERFPERWVRIAKVISTCIVLLFGFLLIWMCVLCWLRCAKIRRRDLQFHLHRADADAELAAVEALHDHAAVRRLHDNPQCCKPA